MALFGRKKRSGGAGEIYVEDEILGTLDELWLKRIKLNIRTKSCEEEVNVYEVLPDDGIIKIQSSPVLDSYAGENVICGFGLDYAWYVFPSKLINQRGRFALSLPKVIKRTQRRKEHRVSLTSREKVRVTALEGLGAGIGITGYASDVSLGGVCVAIERAMQLQSERELPPHAELLKRGTKLAIVKINRIPTVPAFDTTGTVNRIFRDGTWKIAIAIPKIPPNIKELLTRFIEARRPKIKPIRRSRKRRLEMEAQREQERKEREEQKNRYKTEEQAKKEVPKSEVTPEVTPEVAPEEVKEREVAFVKEDGDSSVTAMDTVGSEEFEAVQVEQPTPAHAGKTAILSIGQGLEENLGFLSNQGDFFWHHVANPLKIVKAINEDRPSFLISTLMFKRQSMLDYLQRLHNVGILKGVTIILFSTEDIPMKDIVKIRMLGIKHTFKLPLEAEESLMDILEGHPPAQ